MFFKLVKLHYFLAPHRLVLTKQFYSFEEHQNIFRVLDTFEGGVFLDAVRARLFSLEPAVNASLTEISCLAMVAIVRIFT